MEFLAIERTGNNKIIIGTFACRDGLCVVVNEVTPEMVHITEYTNTDESIGHDVRFVCQFCKYSMGNQIVDALSYQFVEILKARRGETWN